MDRVKMSRQDRARQFAPFDALKGLHEALRIKEYEHDKRAKSEMSEEQIKEISDTLTTLRKNERVEVIFFRDGHELNIKGNCRVDIINHTLYVGEMVILFEDIIKIKKLNPQN